MPRRPFKGKINVDVRDSVPDWEPYMPPRAPEGSPNILIVLYDDTGMAAWEPFGGRIRMPTLERLAEGGLRYSQWHTTALCSPTRSCLLTGRNHHQNGMACIVEGATGYPGSNAHLPKECGTIAASCATTAGTRTGSARTTASRRRRPTRAVRSSTGRCSRASTASTASSAARPTSGIRRWSRTTTRSTSPTRPRRATTCPRTSPTRRCRCSATAGPPRRRGRGSCGSARAPTTRRTTSDRVGRQVQGPVRRRLRGLPRVGAGAHGREGRAARGHRPHADQPDARGHATARYDDVRPWDSLSDDEKRLFARMAEVYAGFSEYTDHQVGRIIDYLEESGQLDNTIVLYCADNGASGEGSPNGSVNENKFFNGWPDEMEENLEHIDDLGSPNTYNHYPTGWAVAFSTPFKMFKRYSYAGGTCDPLVIHWPAGIEARGEVRHQYHHVTDIVPTILDCCGLEFPDDDRRRRAGPARRACRCATRSTTPTRRRPSSGSTTRCSAPAASGRRAGRPSRCTGRPRASGTSTRTSGSSTTSTRTAPRRTTSPPSTRTSSRS